MELILFLTLSFFKTIVAADLKQTLFVSYLPLQDKNITSGVVTRSPDVQETECARECLWLQTCESFFYNTVTAECQYHDAVITSSAGATDQKGLLYYTIVKGQSDRCLVENGFQLLTENGPCVKFHTDRKTWYEANQTCVSYSPYSRLVVLDNQEKNEQVKAAGMAINDQFGTPVWIGMSESDRDVYKWVNGMVPTYTDWITGDWSTPQSQDCVCHYRQSAWGWTKKACTDENHYICEIE